MTPASVPMGTALVVECDPALQRQISSALDTRFNPVRTACTLAQARESLATQDPALMVVEVRLPDGSGLDLLRGCPYPRTLPIVATSPLVSASEAHELDELGVAAYLSQPFSPAELVDAVQLAVDSLPDPGLWASALVGHLGLRDVEAEVRRAMVVEALLRAGGSRRGAARMLGVSRQFLQHAIRSLRDRGELTER